MARLFVTSRELNLISDLTKELTKDVCGQVCNYYSVSELKTKAHTVYNESPEKCLEAPIAIECLASPAEAKTTSGQFGVDLTYTIEVFLHARDLVHRGINPSVGDFFSYGAMLFEIVTLEPMRNIYGQVEHKDGYKVTGQTARESQLKVKILGPTNEKYTDADAVQTTFVQERGLSTNRLGPTGDVRDLQKNGILDPPATGPAEVSPTGDATAGGASPSSFYDES